MAKVHTLEVRLRRDYKSPLEYTPEVSLSAGALAVVQSVFAKGEHKEEAAPRPPLFKDRRLQFIDAAAKDQAWLEIGWSDIVPPEECTLSRYPSFIYCSTINDLIKVEITEDVNYCPLCGKKL